MEHVCSGLIAVVVVWWLWFQGPAQAAAAVTALRQVRNRANTCSVPQGGRRQEPARASISDRKEVGDSGGRGGEMVVVVVKKLWGRALGWGS